MSLSLKTYLKKDKTTLKLLAVDFIHALKSLSERLKLSCRAIQLRQSPIPTHILTIWCREECVNYCYYNHTCVFNPHLKKIQRRLKLYSSGIYKRAVKEKVRNNYSACAASQRRFLLKQKENHSQRAPRARTLPV